MIGKERNVFRSSTFVNYGQNGWARADALFLTKGLGQVTSNLYVGRALGVPSPGSRVSLRKKKKHAAARRSESVFFTRMMVWTSQVGLVFCIHSTEKDLRGPAFGGS